MLPNHRGKGLSGPHQTRNVEAVVTGDRRVLVCRTNRVHGDHCLEPRPFGKLRQGHEVRYGPHSPPDQTSMGVIERIKEIVLLAPQEMVFDLLMKVLFHRCRGLAMIAFEGEEVVASLREDLLSDSRLAAHRINRHNTAFDG